MLDFFLPRSRRRRPLLALVLLLLEPKHDERLGMPGSARAAGAAPAPRRAEYGAVASATADLAQRVGDVCLRTPVERVELQPRLGPRIAKPPRLRLHGPVAEQSEQRARSVEAVADEAARAQRILVLGARERDGGRVPRKSRLRSTRLTPVAVQYERAMERALTAESAVRAVHKK